MGFSKNPLLIPAIFILIAILPSFVSAWPSDYESWQYRKAITINGSTTEHANYQVRINLTSSNFDFSKANSEGNDTRFTWLNTTSGLEQNISFWIENWTYPGANGNATIWVKVPNVTASSVADTTIYMYYGNPSANYNNSLGGNNTFDFFDDFNRADSASLGSNWIETEAGSAAATIVSNQMLINDSGTDAERKVYADTAINFSGSIAAEWDEYPDAAGAALDTSKGISFHKDTDNFIAFVHNGNHVNDGNPNSSVINGKNAGIWITRQNTDIGSYPLAVWRKMKVEYTSTNQKFYVDGGLALTSTNSMSLNPYLLSFWVAYIDVYRNADGNLDNRGLMYVDNFRVRSYMSPEPFALSVGAEEGHPVYWLKTYSTSGNAKSFFATNETVAIKTKAYNGSGKITITGPDGIVRVNNANMTNESALSNGVLVWNYSFNLTNATGWYDVRISGNEQNGSFFVGGVWQNNWTDSEGKMFPFRTQVNISEPNIIERFFEPVDIFANFTYKANSSSIRVAQWNGSNLIDVPSQSYNLSYNGSYAASGNLVFLSTSGKNQNSTYYIYYARSNTAPAYGTDLAVANNSGVYEIQNMNYRVVLDETKGGIIRDAYNLKGTNENLAGYNPMQLSPEALGSALYRASSLATPAISLLNSSLFAKYMASGTYGNMKFNITYKHYSHAPYMILETNISPTTGETWDYYYDQNFRLRDGYFSKATWKNSSGVFEYDIGAGNGADIISLGNIEWLAAYNNASRDSFGTIFLSNSQVQSINLNSEFYDDGSYEFYRRRQFSASPSSVTASDYFYSKTAIVLWNAIDSYEKLNETYYRLKNPLTANIGASEVYDSEKPAYTIANYTPQNPKDNESVTCYSYWTDNMELDYAIITINSSGYSNMSVMQIDANESWVNYTLNASALEAGIFTCNITVYDTATLTNSTQTSFGVSDNTPPYFASITNLPETNMGLDPGIQINITANITEYTGVDSAILQYRNDSGAEWANTSMNKTWNGTYGYTYLANFTPGSEGTWQYRIYTNDTLGNSNYSAINNLSIFYEWTWKNSPADFGAVSGVLASNISVGNITINSTSDKQLSFKLASNWNNKNEVYFNGTPEGDTGFIIDLNPETSGAIPIKVTAQSAERSDGLNITISALNSSAIPLANTTVATIVSYSSGPFLLVTITEYNASVTQGDTGIVLKAKVQNKGNGTATNTWLAFELPSGWSVTSGSLNKSIGTLSVDSIAYNQITASISESAATGAQIIKAYAGSMQNKSGLGSANTYISAKQTVQIITETVPVSSGGSSSGSAAGLTSEQKEKIFQTEKTYELVRGHEHNFTLKVENPFDGTLKDVSVQVSGFLAQYLSVEPEKISEIPVNESADFIILIEAPKYFTRGEYALNFTITGIVNKTASKNAIHMKESRQVTLIIYEIPKEEAETYFNESISLLKEMNKRGLSSEEINGIASGIEESFENKDYEAVKQTYEAVKEKKETAFSALSMLDDVKQKRDAAIHDGIEVLKTSRIILLAKYALDRGDYETAKKRAEDAQVTYALEVSGKFNPVAFARNNWQSIGIAAVFFFIASYLGFLSLKFNLVNKKISSLKKEKDILLGLIKEIQKDCFEQGKLSMEEYFESLIQYEKKISKVVQETIMLESIKANLFNFLLNETGNLLAEREKLLDLIRATQQSYLQSESIETRTYQSIVKTYAERLAEIEERLADLEVKKTIKIGALKPSGLIKYLLFAIVFSILFSSLALAVSEEGIKAGEALSSAEKDMAKMAGDGLSVIRYNDTLAEARQLYGAQIALETAKGSPDYSVVYRKINGLGQLKFDAYKIYDELRALDATMNQTKGADLTQSNEIYGKAVDEFKSERYEESLKLIGSAYEKISESEALGTKVIAVYESTSKNILGFFLDNWKATVISLAISAIITSVMYGGLSRFLLKRSIEHLEKRKDSLKKLIAKTQKEYFEEGTISETSYGVRIKKYGELIRDLNRELPILREELAKKDVKNNIRYSSNSF